MKKATIDMDATATIRRSPEARPGTLTTYTALRELATEAGGCDFTTKANEISKRSLLSDSATTTALNLLERRRLIDRYKTPSGIRVRLLKVARS